MVQRTTEALSDLYLADETAWLDAMADLIRAGQLSEVDYPHLAEYLEDMANRDRKEVSSRLRILLIHLLKWFYQSEKRTPSWRSTIREQQNELEPDLEGGVLRNHADETLAAIYGKARKLAADETDLPVDAFPSEGPWTLDQLMSFDILAE